MRESPALKVIENLEREGAKVIYNDPYIPKFTHNNKNYKSEDLTDELLQEVDAVLITTCHSLYDYEQIVNNAQIIFDTAMALKALKG